MQSSEHDEGQPDVEGNPSTRPRQGHFSPQASAQQGVPPGYGRGRYPGMESFSPGQPLGMGPYGLFQPPSSYGPGQPPGMGMYGPGHAAGTPPYGPGQASGSTPHMPPQAGYYYWPYAMPGPAYPPYMWTPAPYFGPPGPQSSGPSASQAPGETGAGIDGLMRDVMDGNFSLSSLTQWVGLGDSEFWKGALIGAAIVLLLTNDSIKQALFGSRGTTVEPSTPSGDNG